MRVGFRTLFSLALCAAAAAAALAHVAIDVVGDYALSHDTYDNLRHGSRELVSLAALGLAVALAWRGLRLCFEMAAANRARIPRPSGTRFEPIVFVAGAIALTATLVPAMEWFDGRLDGVAVRELGDAFGGSILLGLGTTVLCASLVALAIYAFARWLISHRDSIATIIETLLRRLDGAQRPAGRHLTRHIVSVRRRRTAHALRLTKRGPPEAIFA
ncbi:MAG: hypothetical protein WA814_04470 [Candidatus Baltobacteraceae bacterium]